MKPVLVIRPEPGLAATYAAGRARGLDMRAMPLFEVRPLTWDMPHGRFDAIVLGSANAIRHAGAGITKLRGLPVFAVGPATAEAAAAAGFTVAAVGQGGLQSLLDGLDPAPERMLRLCGADRKMLAPRVGQQIVDCPVYQNCALSAPGELREFAATGAVVLLHSERAARHFSSECNRMRLDRSKFALVALGPIIAEVAGNGWSEVQSAAVPRDQALLALAENMCQ